MTENSLQQSTISVSVAVIAKNEADRIGRLIDSVKFADEVVVVDSGSTDGTQQISAQAGARVINNEWPGYAAQKQFAMEQTRSEWILNLDADEEISDTLADEIRQAVKTAQSDVVAFSMPRLSRYLGRWIRHGGWYPDRKVRLVRRGRGRWKGEGLHETLEVNGKVGRLTEPMLHHVYRNISDQIATIDKFSDLYAKERGPAGVGFAVIGIVHALGKFLECYLWKLGILDGLPGLIIAVNSAWYIFLKHAKSWELGRSRSDR